MKLSILLFLWSIVSVVAQLGDPAFVSALTRTTTTTCATTDTTLTHSLFLEGFQTATTGYENSWTEVGTTANITAAADSSALTTGKPTGACNQAWKLVVPTDGTETYGNYAFGPYDLDTGSLDVYYYFYIETAPSTSVQYQIVRLTAAGGVVVSTTLWNNAGTLEIRTGANTDSAWENVSASTWVKVKIHLDTSTGVSACYMSVNDGTSRTFQRIASRNPTSVRIGAPYNLDALDDGTLWFDLVTLNVP